MKSYLSSWFRVMVLVLLAGLWLTLLPGCPQQQHPVQHTQHKLGEPVNYKTTYSFPGDDGKMLYFDSEEDMKVALQRMQANRSLRQPPTSTPAVP